MFVVLYFCPGIMCAYSCGWICAVVSYIAVLNSLSAYQPLLFSVRFIWHLMHVVLDSSLVFCLMLLIHS